MDIYQRAMERQRQRNKTKVLTYMRRLQEVVRTARDEMDRAGASAEDARQLEIHIPDMIVHASDAIVCALVYAPFRLAEWPIRGDDSLRAGFFLNPLDIGVAHCELPSGECFELVAEPLAYTRGLKLDDHIAHVEEVGDDEVFSRSVLAHFDRMDAIKAGRQCESCVTGTGAPRRPWRPTLPWPILPQLCLPGRNQPRP